MIGRINKITMPREEPRLEKDADAQAEAWGGGWGWKVCLRWVGYTTLGYLLRGLIAAATPTFALALMVGALSLGVVAFLQWLILRRYLVELRWWSWVLATVLGQLAATIGLALGAAGSLILGPRVLELIGVAALQLLTGVVLGGLPGGVVGFAQWLVLRRHLAAAVWWIPATFLAGAAIVLLFPSGLGASFSKAGTPLLMQLISGVIVGSITGMTLILLLRKRQAHLTRPLPIQ